MTSAPRRSASAASAIAHTAGGSVSDVAHGIEWLARPARGDEDALPGERAVRRDEERLDPGQDLLRLGHAPDSLLALGELAGDGTDELDAARAEGRDVRLRRCVAPHPRVHGRRDEHGTRMRERRLGQDVVGEALRQTRERVRSQRRDDEEVEATEVRVRVVGRRPARQRRERLGGDEALGARGEHGVHFMAAPDEQPYQRAGLVGRDPAGDSEQDARHALALSSRVRAA